MFPYPQMLACWIKSDFSQIVFTRPSTPSRVKGSVLITLASKSEKAESSNQGSLVLCSGFDFFIVLLEVIFVEDGGSAHYPGNHRSKVSWPFNRKSVPPAREISIFNPGDSQAMYPRGCLTILTVTTELQVLANRLQIRGNGTESLLEGTFSSRIEKQQQ